MAGRFVLDSHVLLWAMVDDLRLGQEARGIITSPNNEIFVSAVSVWEITIKRALGKLRAPDDLVGAIREYGFLELPITSSQAERAGNLPLIHRDPFDRMLVAQAELEGLVLITNDSNIRRYGVSVMPV